MNYTDNQSALQQYTGDSGYEANTDWQAQLPVFIFSAENRILRDLDLLAARVTDVSGSLTANSREFVLPTKVGIFQIVETIAVIDAAGIRHPPLLPVSKEFLDAAYPDEHAVGDPSIPRKWAPYTAAAVLVGPAPSDSFAMQVYGVQYPATLSEDNTETFISVNLPDLFLAAEMIDVSAWCKNFGAMSDNPAQARDWDQEYERLKGVANAWELRRKVQGSGWSTRLPNPVARPPATRPGA
jgi:hypothetical protein